MRSKTRQENAAKECPCRFYFKSVNIGLRRCSKWVGGVPDWMRDARTWVCPLNMKSELVASSGMKLAAETPGEITAVLRRTANGDAEEPRENLIAAV